MPEITSKSSQSNALIALIEHEKPTLMQMLPAHLQTAKTAARFFEFAMALKDNEKLARCKPETIRKSLYKAAQWGLPLDGVHASLIPYGADCTYVPGYMGYAAIYRRSGDIEDVWGKVAFEGDEFEVTEGTHPDIVHKPRKGVDRTNINNVVAAYACARRKGTGNIVFEVVWKDVLMALREKCLKRAYKPEESPWTREPIEMFRKTPIIRLRKSLPLTEEMATLTAEAEYSELGHTREPEFEVVERPQSLSELKDAATKRKKAETQAVKAGTAEDVLDEMAGNLPAVRIVEGVTITINEQDVSWRSENVGGRSAFAGQTWESLAHDGTAGIDELLAKGVAAGQKEESEGKIADKRWQYAALVLEARKQLREAGETF